MGPSSEQDGNVSRGSFLAGGGGETAQEAIFPRRMDGADQQAGDVVVAVAGFCRFNQIRAGFFQRILIYGFCHCFFLDVARHAVAAEQEHIAGIELVVGEVGLHAVVGAEGTDDHVLHFGLLGFFHGHETAADLLHHKGVVVGELDDIFVADEVDAAVADIGDGEEIAIDGDGHDGGTHAGMIRIARAGFVDGLISGLNGAGEGDRAGGEALEAVPADGSGAVILAEKVEDSIDADFAGEFAEGLASHAVADDEDSVAKVVAEIVLVIFADETDVGDAGGLDQESHCKR
jgi:hypothetical protein